uniref:dephospho-CoA kinase n=1 Tax=Flavobacterium sp. TaxID=239 RepID=UPI0035B4EE10
MTKIIGLTGGIGSGKTTVARFFEQNGVPVYIADDEARKLMSKVEIIAEIQSVFAEKITDKDGNLDRKKISQIVFNDSVKLEKLNAIIHPKVKAHFQHWLMEHAKY